MALTHSDVLIIDATATIGLFLFLTFQSFNPIIVNDVTNYLDKYFDAEVELFTIEKQLDDCESGKHNFYNDTECSELRTQKFDSLSKYETFMELGEYYGYIDEKTNSVSSYVNFVLKIPFYMSQISTILIFPFVLSAIVESISVIRKKDDQATRPGVIILLIGFCAIIVGLAIIGGLAYLSDQDWYANDADNDGLTDNTEEEIGTDKNNPDTDGDGLNDEMEYDHYNTNPTEKTNEVDRFKNI